MSFWKKLVELFVGPQADDGMAPRAQEQPAPGQPGASTPQHPVAPAPPPGAPPPRQPVAPAPPRPRTPPPTRRHDGEHWDAGDLLALSPEEMRARAVQIVPWKTPWIYRTDVIPPQSDERTALIDRGLVLAGYLTEDQLRTIHEIGDRWLEHREAEKLAKSRAARSADAAIQARRAEAAERKQRLRNEAAERRRRRAEEVARRRATDIVYIGRGVSRYLGDRRAHVEALEAAGLPILATPADVAAALDVTIPQLRWLCYHAEALEAPHYAQFDVPKRSGGTRRLAAPKAHLRRAQRWVLDEILSKVEPHPAAQGFIAGRSTVTNATPHRGRAVVINLDLVDFFPSILFHRVRGLFQSLGYSPAAATLLAALCTESPRRPLEYDGKTYWVEVGDRALPQGACTSPAISNLVSRRLDRRLMGFATKRALRYTRYADDLTLSSQDRHENIGKLLAQVRHIVEEEGFRLHPGKIRVQRAGQRQTVTGIVVNEPTSLGLPREEVRRLRAILHNAQKTGLAAQNRDGHPDFRAYLRGKLAYLAMVDPAKAAPMIAKLEKLR